MNDFKNRKGSDGLDAFTIPVHFSSQDKILLALDQISMEEFLKQNNFGSSYLKWYVNYCCADDYGSCLADTSAWAAIHYFASRRGKSFNASSDSVLTWPEGNFWLVNKLKEKLNDNIRTDSMVFQVTANSHGVEVLYLDVRQNTTIKLLAKTAILATPQFINQRILKNGRAVDYNSFQYNPWIVANITVNSSLNEKRGEPLSWDNVIYGSKGLGYVNSAHQQVGSAPETKVITYYRPLVDGDSRTMRTDAFNRNYTFWRDLVIEDLNRPHPKIERNIDEMNVWIWGHGMIKPEPNFIWNTLLSNARKQIDNKIFFGHSDLSGISIFEEAFYRGHRAAAALLENEKT